eukprot:363029-Chlamydomonas_euryale.AAC.7
MSAKFEFLAECVRKQSDAMEDALNAKPVRTKSKKHAYKFTLRTDMRWGDVCKHVPMHAHAWVR